MSSSSAIEWTDATWNPVTGCDRVSPGCAHCYALELAPRLRRFAQARGGGKWAVTADGGKSSGPAFGVTLHPGELERPLRWRKPRRVFVNSMSDLFHDEVPFAFVAAVFGVMAAAPQHTFQVLTKRPERMRAFFGWHAEGVAELDLRWEPWRLAEDYAREYVPELPAAGALAGWPLQNVWLGVSIENRRFVHRADTLRATPAAVRFISAEPLLGPLIADEIQVDWPADGEGPRRSEWWNDGYEGPELDLDDIDWLIVGGESGTRHRPMHLDWARDLRDAAAAAGTAFFLKQIGGARPGGDALLDGREWREFPTPTVPA